MKKHKNKINEKIFDRITHTSAYWLGVIFSDGNMHEGKTGTKNISFVTKDVEFMKNFLIFLETDGKYIIEKINRNEYYRFSFCNKHIYNRLSDLGCLNKKSLILSPPIIKDKFIFSFMCGFFDGDGSISVNQSVNSWKVSFGFGSKIFYEWFKNMLNSKNIIYSIENNRKTPKGLDFYIICMNGISAKYFLSLCYQDVPITTVLKRKYEKFLLLKKQKLVSPNYQKWEDDIILKNINKSNNEISLLINNNKKNYGWKRSEDAIRARIRTLKNKLTNH